MLITENNTAKEILLGTTELFMKYGIKSVSMDDIARHFSMSKKTLYQHFDDKDKLVCECIQISLEKDMCAMQKINAESDDLISEMVAIGEYMKKELYSINPSLMFDLKKYHPKAYKIFNDFKHEFMASCISLSIVKGKEQGYFRKDIDIKAFARIRMKCSNIAFCIFPESY